MTRFILFILFAALLILGGLIYVVWTTSYVSSAPIDGALPFDINYQKKKTEQQDGIPFEISIPAIKVKAHAEQVAFDKEGNLWKPKQYMDVGWYSQDARLGKNGSVIIAGDLLLPNHAPGPFYDLYKLRNGNEIKIKDLNGKEYTYIIQEVTKDKWKTAPRAKLILSNSKPFLNLVTYDSIDPKVEEVIVYAEMKK